MINRQRKKENINNPEIMEAINDKEGLKKQMHQYLEEQSVSKKDASQYMRKLSKYTMDDTTRSYAAFKRRNTNVVMRNKIKQEFRLNLDSSKSPKDVKSLNVAPNTVQVNNRRKLPGKVYERQNSTDIDKSHSVRL